MRGSENGLKLNIVVFSPACRWVVADREVNASPACLIPQHLGWACSEFMMANVLPMISLVASLMLRKPFRLTRFTNCVIEGLSGYSRLGDERGVVHGLR